MAHAPAGRQRVAERAQRGVERVRAEVVPRELEVRRRERLGRRRVGPRRRRALGRVGAAAPLDRRRGLVGTPRGVQGLGQQHGDLGLEALRQSHGPPEGRDGLVEAPQVRRGLRDNQISGAPAPNSLVDFRTGRCDTKRVQRADVVGRARQDLCGNQNLRRVRAESSRRPPRHRRECTRRTG